MKPKSKRYPHMGFRPMLGVDARLTRLAERMTKQLHRRVTISEIINTALGRYLPELEAKHQ